ncbi:arsenate reductase/protein-tyrosine-phosphatase family protein [Boseongicola aestuarii]|uniref:protein-tyrosine-phosphatase n=1 Tax=Boseongicola aestuarii TaxID=1470561 RepID=A0A238IZY7_9RHOB|nr:phosphotyrosine protein phosphatase [Boseongicola aestuarii]SMX23623.1 Low molecular weight protein-tyrosine-phosphatase etp [Boseongicola aestuarii]
MIRSILVVCVGNVCRSPVGERLLSKRLSGVEVTSAGIAALVGKPADGTMTEVATDHGLSLDGHLARQFTAEIGAGAELILVMEPGHKREIARMAPELTGRMMLFDQWTGSKGIADPYRHPRESHETAFDQLTAAADAWAARLAPGGNQ